MSQILSHALTLLDTALGQIFQATCIACGQLSIGSSLCSFCSPISFLRDPICLRCGEPISHPMDRCGGCLRISNTPLLRIRSVLWLTESAKAIVHKIKYSGRFELLCLFRQYLKESKRFFPDGTVAIPVPLHPKRRIARGFNQSDILARWMAKEWNLEIMASALEKIKETPPQSMLSKTERKRNLKGSFLAAKGNRFWQSRSVPKQVLLVDDVYTTGSTLEVCAQVLKNAGTEMVFAWTLFRTPRMDPQATPQATFATDRETPSGPPQPPERIITLEQTFRHNR